MLRIKFSGIPNVVSLSRCVKWKTNLKSDIRVSNNRDVTPYDIVNIVKDKLVCVKFDSRSRSQPKDTSEIHVAWDIIEDLSEVRTLVHYSCVFIWIVMSHTQGRLFEEIL